MTTTLFNYWTTNVLTSVEHVTYRLVLLNKTE